MLRCMLICISFSAFFQQKVLVSIGYKGVPLPGMDSSMFDKQQGIVQNIHGRVNAASGLYVAGWLKRGPSGIIGTNIADAKDTVASIMMDIKDGTIYDSKGENLDVLSKDGRVGLDVMLFDRQIKFVNWAQYQSINEAEKDPKRLRSSQQPREKICSIDEMISHTSK